MFEGGWGRVSWFLINRKGLLPPGSLSAQLLGHNLSWGWGCGGGARTDRQADGQRLDRQRVALQARPTPAHPQLPGKSLSREKAQPVSTAPSCSPPPALSSLLLLSPTSGTFNPSFDGQPKKDFFHILNLLAPANHLNLPPSCAPNRRLLKDTACFFESQQGAPGGTKFPPPPRCPSSV